MSGLKTVKAITLIPPQEPSISTWVTWKVDHNICNEIWWNYDDSYEWYKITKYAIKTVLDMTFSVLWHLEIMLREFSKHYEDSQGSSALGSAMKDYFTAISEGV